MMRKLLVVTLPVLALVGCELIVDFDRTKIPADGTDSSVTPPPSPGIDGAVDGGETDAGEEPDSGETDAGEEPDSGETDGGEEPDSGETDGGDEPDGGDETDAGDAGDGGN